MRASQLIKLYNGEMNSIENIKIDLEEKKAVTVIGNGNVATDIGRILL